MEVLVTGASGFLGRYIVRQLLLRGDAVRCLVRQADPELESLGGQIVLGDIRDPLAVERAVRGVQTVVHTAAKAGIWGPWQDFYQTNVVGTRNVLSACKRHGVARLVFSSSPSVTFDGTDQCGVDETAPYAKRWLCHYPHTKALAEQAVLAAHQVSGLATCALRPHLIWGPGDRHLIPRILDRARTGQLIRVGDGQNRIDTIYVENAAQAHVQAAEALEARPSSGGRAYFISQDEPVNCWDWIDTIVQLHGLPPVTRSLSYRTAWAVGHALEWVYRIGRVPGEPRMTRFLAAQLAKSHYFDIRAAKSELGYRPEITTEMGLQRLVDAACRPQPEKIRSNN